MCGRPIPAPARIVLLMRPALPVALGHLLPSARSRRAPPRDFQQATSDAYPYCASWALPWNFRRRAILRELVNYRADILCLQEVQADHFENFLEPELAKYNYAGLYKCKTREFMGQYGKMDGCAIFYRRDKFQLAPNGSTEVEFNSIARQRHSNDKRLLNRLLKDNVAQVQHR